MRIGEVIGRVTLSRFLPQLRGGRFLIALPMPLAALTQGSSSRGEDVVVYDSLGAGAGSLIGVSEGREAANPFGPDKVPVDAYCACLIDHLTAQDTDTHSIPDIRPTARVRKQ
jgi:microcompartment protein CcmK/EutM